MGTDKARLLFDGESMLARVVRRLSEAARPIIVVAAADQELPPLPESIRVVRDQREHAGPMEGVRAGLAALLEAGFAPTSAAYVTSCDVPLLVPAFVRLLASLLDDFDIVVPAEVAHESTATATVAGAANYGSAHGPVGGSFYHPLAAVYRLAVLPKVTQLLASDQRRMTSLLDECHTRRVPIDELRDVDPRLESLLNLNRPADYEQALRRV